MFEFSWLSNISKGSDYYQFFLTIYIYLFKNQVAE